MQDPYIVDGIVFSTLSASTTILFCANDELKIIERIMTVNKLRNMAMKLMMSVAKLLLMLNIESQIDHKY